MKNPQDKIRILHFIYGLNIGGAESFLKSLFAAVDSPRFELNVVLQDRCITNLSLYQVIMRHAGGG